MAYNSPDEAVANVAVGNGYPRIVRKLLALLLEQVRDAFNYERGGQFVGGTFTRGDWNFPWFSNLDPSRAVHISNPTQLGVVLMTHMFATRDWESGFDAQDYANADKYNEPAWTINLNSQVFMYDPTTKKVTGWGPSDHYTKPQLNL